MTELDEFALLNEATELFDEPLTESAEIIDIRELRIAGLPADAADRTLAPGALRCPG